MSNMSFDTFPWRRQELGGGSLQMAPDKLLLRRNDAVAAAYSNAQIDDYSGLPRRRMRWRPPVTLELRARFSHPNGALRGTAGFGFWNNPFMPPTLPRAAWFFYASPPSNMKLDLLAPGAGWKAATIDGWRLPFLLLAPTAPLAVPLMHIPPLYRALWPIGQMALGVREAPITSDMCAWHSYSLHWEPRRARFAVDGATVLDTPLAPGGPLGFVLWLDNQYAVVTPFGALGGGLLAAPGSQWLEVDSLRILAL